MASLQSGFHLHPSARTKLSQDRHTALISMPNNDGWALALRDGVLSLDESVYLTDTKGPRRTVQVVIYGMMGSSSDITVNWTLERMAQAADKSAEPDREREKTNDLPLGNSVSGASHVDFPGARDLPCFSTGPIMLTGRLREAVGGPS